MLELSLFADESGEDGTSSRYYLLTLVFHEQSRSVSSSVGVYEDDIRVKGLPDIPFHASPLMNGNGRYAGMDIQDRKRLLQSFFILTQHLPIRYHSFVYRKSEFANGEALTARLRRDIINLMFDKLEYLQGFDGVKVYYDDGQVLVTKALHDAVEYALCAEVVTYKYASPSDYRLSQVADLLCTLELTAVKYEAKENTRTDDRFFGAFGNFKKNWLKKIRKKHI